MGSSSFFPGAEVGSRGCNPHGHLTFDGENSNATACRAGWLQELVHSCRDVLNSLGVERLLTASDTVPSEFSHAACLAACHCCSNSGSGPLSLYCSWGVGVAGRPGSLCGLPAQQPGWLLPLVSPVRCCLLSPLAVGRLDTQPVAVGRVGLSMIHPSLQGSLRQSLGEHSKADSGFLATLGYSSCSWGTKGVMDPGDAFTACSTDVASAPQRSHDTWISSA